MKEKSKTPHSTFLQDGVLIFFRLMRVVCVSTKRDRRTKRRPSRASRGEERKNNCGEEGDRLIVCYIIGNPFSFSIPILISQLRRPLWSAHPRVGLRLPLGSWAVLFHSLFLGWYMGCTNIPHSKAGFKLEHKEICSVSCPDSPKLLVKQANLTM